MTKIALLGCGYWGPNLLRNFHNSPDATVSLVCDESEERRAFVNAKYPDIRCEAASETAFADPAIDAVVIATPATTHYPLACAALQAGKHMFVEKPLAMRSAEAAELVQEASDRDLVLMVGHVFLYNAGVQTVRSYIDEGRAGDIHYVTCQRLNLGRVRSDVNVIWNLAPHDVSILLYLLQAEPVSVAAHGRISLQPGIEDAAFITVAFPGGVLGHVHVSWLDPCKVRRVAVVGTRAMIINDDVADHKVQVYESGLSANHADASLGDYEEFGEFQLLKRAGDVHVPHIEYPEPLKVEAEDFIRAIETGVKPVADGENGLAVVRVLEAAEQSLRQNGAEVAIA